MTTIRQSALVAGFALLVALSSGRSATAGDPGPWIGREFTPRTTCQPMVGNRQIPLQSLPRPFKVERVAGDWLWVGRAWVRKQDVVPVEDVIEEFDVARHGDFLLVPVTIDGRQHRFVVDTGFTWSVVDKSLESHLQPTGETKRLNGKPGFPIYHLPTTDVGTSRFPVPGDVLCLDLEPFRKYSGHDFRGILGMTFLKDKILRIDFDRGKLALLRSPPGQHENSFALSYCDWRIPMVTLDVARERPISFKLDTGMLANHCGEIAGPIFEAMVLAGHVTLTGNTVGSFMIDGEHHRRLATLKECRLGTFEHASVRFSEGEHSLLGLAYLARFHVTFDFRNDRIYLRKGAGFNSPAGESRFGAVLYRIGIDTYVEVVRPSSPAADAGLKDGDRIVLIEGRSPVEFSLFELGKQLSVDGRQVQLVVQDDAEPRLAAVRLADWQAPSGGRRKADRVSE